MPTVDLTNPATFVGALAYEHTDIPPGITLDVWRRQRARKAREQRAARQTARHDALRALITLRAARLGMRRAVASGSRAVTS